MTQAHTTDNIAEVLGCALTNWGLSGKISCIVSDNGSNVVAALRKMGLKHLPCFAHTLNLVVQESIRRDELLKEIQLISLNWNPVNRNFRKWVGCEALAPIQDNGSL